MVCTCTITHVEITNVYIRKDEQVYYQSQVAISVVLSNFLCIHVVNCGWNWGVKGS